MYACMCVREREKPGSWQEDNENDCFSCEQGKEKRKFFKVKRFSLSLDKVHLGATITHTHKSTK